MSFCHNMIIRTSNKKLNFLPLRNQQGTGMRRRDIGGKAGRGWEGGEKDLAEGPIEGPRGTKHCIGCQFRDCTV